MYKKSTNALPLALDQVLADQILGVKLPDQFLKHISKLNYKSAIRSRETIAYDKLIDSTNNSVEDQRKDLKTLTRWIRFPAAD